MAQDGSTQASKRLRTATGLPSLIPRFGVDSTSTRAPAKHDGYKKNWIYDQFRVKAATENQPETYCCKHCDRILSGRNVTRLKEHLLNAGVCKFLDTESANKLKNNKDVSEAYQQHHTAPSEAPRYLDRSRKCCLHACLIVSWLALFALVA